LGLSLCAASLAGCSFQNKVPADKVITCSAGSNTCPDGYQCRPAIGRCVSNSDLTKPPVSVTDAQVTPAAGNFSTTFVTTFSVTATLLNPPSVSASAFIVSNAEGALATFPFTCGACAPGAPCTCTFQADPSHPPPEGPLQVRIEVADQLGNEPPPTNAGAILFDVTPPAIASEPPVELNITPAPNVVTPVSALGLGSQAEICFASTEELANPPRVWAADAAHLEVDAGEFAFALESGYPQGLHYCYDFAFGSADADGGVSADAGVSDGVRSVFADLTDVAGNFARAQLLNLADGGLLLDSTPPPPPDQSFPAGLRYRRAPWGELPTIGTPSFSLSSTGPAISEDGYLLVYEDPQAQREILRQPVSAGALPSVSLLPPDRKQVYVDLFDRAGNRSPGGPFLVLNIDWVANLGNKTLGDLITNPNQCFGRIVEGDALLQPDETLNEQDGESGPVGQGAAMVTGGATWRQRTNVPDDANCTYYENCDSQAFAYDSAIGQLVGFFETGANEVWQFNGLDWTWREDVVRMPDDRSWYSMTFDSTRGQAVMFGGEGVVNELCDTWTFDRTTWRKVSDCLVPLADGGTPTNIPPPVFYPVMAEDPQRERIVLLGGSTTDTPTFLDTHAWEWNGHDWSMSPDVTGSLPPKVYGASMVYLDAPDGGQGEFVLSGGTGEFPPGSDNQADTNETWVGQWNGQGYAWHKIAGNFTCTSTTVPGCGHQQLATARNSGTVLMAVEAANGGSVRLWSWDGVSTSPVWVDRGLVAGATTVSALYAFPALVSGTNNPVPYMLYGSSTDGVRTQWLCSTADASSCQVIHHGTQAPQQRIDAAMAADSTNHTLLFGGGGTSSDLGDVWLWNGADWIPGPDGGPSPRRGASLVFLPTTEQFWLYGGNTGGSDINQLWSLKLGVGWTEQLSGVTSAPETNAQLVYVPDAGAVGGGLVLGGSEGAFDPVLVVSDTGNVVSHPLGTHFNGYSLSTLAQMAYDPLRSRLVIEDLGYAMGELDPAGFNWQWLYPSNNPDLPNCTVFDAAAGSVLVLGEHYTENDVLVWRWDGQQLTPITLGDPEGDGIPDFVGYQGCVYEPTNQSILAFGGISANPSPATLTGKTWQLSTANNRPAEVCRFVFKGAGTDPDIRITGIQFMAEAGAGVLRDDGSVTDDNVSMQVWVDGHWQAVAQCDGGTCGINSPGSLSYLMTDPSQLTTVIRDQSTVGAMLTSVSPNGTGVSQVAARSLQAVVSYRLPLNATP
jgi:hypothetical protein